MLGPVQVLVVGVVDAGSADAVLATFRALEDDGPVRGLDAFEIAVTEDGDLVVEGTSSPPSLALFADEAGDGGSGVSSADAWDLTQVLPPGARAVVALLEHRWAIGLRDALVESHAVLRFETWLDDDARTRLESFLMP